MINVGGCEILARVAIAAFQHWDKTILKPDKNNAEQLLIMSHAICSNYIQVQFLGSNALHIISWMKFSDHTNVHSVSVDL